MNLILQLMYCLLIEAQKKFFFKNFFFMMLLLHFQIQETVTLEIHLLLHSLSRAVAERCPEPAMHNLITFGAQHQGVFGIPNCSPNDTLCEEMRLLLSQGAYIEYS